MNMIFELSDKLVQLFYSKSMDTSFLGNNIFADTSFCLISGGPVWSRDPPDPAAGVRQGQHQDGQEQAGWHPQPPSLPAEPRATVHWQRPMWVAPTTQSVRLSPELALLFVLRCCFLLRPVVSLLFEFYWTAVSLQDLLSLVEECLCFSCDYTWKMETWLLITEKEFCFFVFFLLMVLCLFLIATLSSFRNRLMPFPTVIGSQKWILCN